MPENPNDYALVIGIEKYPDWNQGRKNLQGPVADAEMFFTWLKDKTNGGGLPPENIELVVTQDVPGQNRPAPIGQDISDALKKITMKVVLKDQGSPHRFYLFYSGHGHTVPSRPRDTNLCMAPFSEDRFGLSEALSLEDILGKVTNCLAPAELLVFLDCCRSVIVSAAGVDTTFACVTPEAAAGDVREAILYATLRFRGAFEGGDVVRGHFSRALIDGLNGLAQVNGQVTLESLRSYLKKEVPNLSNTDNHFQEVELAGSAELMGAVLGTPRQEAVVSIHFSPQRSGDIILENGDLEVVRQGDASTGPWDLTLGRGKYSLRDVASAEEKFFDVRLGGEVQNVTF
jgi:hypothetical protein